jgi:hypothetical protein
VKESIEILFFLLGWVIGKHIGGKITLAVLQQFSEMCASIEYRFDHVKENKNALK